MNEYLELLKRLIQCRPVSADPASVDRASNILKDFLEARGIRCVMEKTLDRMCLYASTCPGKVQDLLLNAHVDVVPAATEDQYEPYEKDGWLYGRGTGDCLGNAVCIARFLCSVKDSASVGAVFTSDEELGGMTAREMIKRGYGARKAVLILDSCGNYNITHAQKGILILKLTAHSCGGHSAKPWGIPNPIEALMNAYGQICSQWVNPVSETDWKNSMSVCMISGGSAENQIPDAAEMLLNFRYIADEDYGRIIKLAQSTGLDVSVVRTCPPVETDKNAPAVQLLKQAFEKVLKRPAEFRKMCGATDARHFKEIGVPVAILGTESKGIHSAEEKLNLESLDIYHRILTEYLALLK